MLERWEGIRCFWKRWWTPLQRASRRADVVLAAVEARFDCLSPEVRRVLRGASLYGDKSFSAEALVAVLGEASRREMGEWLENLVMRDLVHRQADGSEVAYRLRNKLVREAAYGCSLGRPRARSAVGTRVVAGRRADAARLPDCAVFAVGRWGGWGNCRP